MGAYLYCLKLGTVIKINKLTEAMRVKKKRTKISNGLTKIEERRKKNLKNLDTTVRIPNNTN